jgi:CheY-like chemotaxis protein
MTTIVIVNANDELIEILAEVFRRDGYDVVTAHSRDVREGSVDLLALLAQHEPAVLVYDVAVPYEENWAFVQRLRATAGFGSGRLILTSTNKPALERLVGPTDTIEIVGKPFDVEQIRDVVRRTEAAGGSRVSPS